MTLAARFGHAEYFASLLRSQFALAFLLAIAAAGFVRLSGTIYPLWGIGPYAFEVGFMLFFRLIQEFMRRALFVQGKGHEAVGMDVAVCLIIVSGIAALYGRDILAIGPVLVVHAIAYAICLYGYFTASEKNPEQRLKTDMLLAQHWHFGGWLLAAAIVAYASSNLLVVAGSAILGSETAGLIKAAQYAMGGMIVMFQAVENVLPHYMAKLAHHGQENDFRTVFYKSAGLMLGFGVLHGALSWALIEPIAGWLAPGHETVFKPVMLLSIFVSLLIVLNYVMQYAFRAHGNTRPIFIANAVTAAVSAIVAKPIAVHFGVMGIAWGLALMNVIVLIIFVCLKPLQSTKAVS
jgi:O-antigen/teichoic acid export membrane protein